MSLTANGQRIVVNDVHLSYGSHAGLRGLTLHVAAGEIYATRARDAAERDILTARENAAYLLALAGRRPEPQAIDAAFEATGLQEAAWDKRLGGFSKGMRQKVAIAIALLREVPVLLLDEPSSGLDPKATADFNRLVHDVARRGAAVLMVTHDLLSAADIADRIGFLEAGRIVDEAAAQGADRFDVRDLHRKFPAESVAA